MDNYKKWEDKKVHNTSSFYRKTLAFSVLALKKLMLKNTKARRKLKFFEGIFLFIRDILGILDSFRYFRNSEFVNYHFLVSFQMVIQTYDSFGMQGFYH